MILTDISRTKQGKIALFFDGAFVCSVSPEAYAQSGLCVGSELDGEAVQALRAAAETEKAKQKALTLLSYKEYTSAELEQRLRAYAAPEAAAQAVERMAELGLLDDDDYAERYARDLAGRKGYGQRRIRMEMRRKGLPAEAVEFALSHLETDPVGQARALLEKKYPLWQEDESVKRRAYGALARRGFDADDIRRAMADEEYD